MFMHVPVISTSGEMFMKLMVNIARVLILIAEMDSAGSNYPGAVPRWCLATARPSIIEQPRRHFRGWSKVTKRLTRVKERV